MAKKAKTQNLTVSTNPADNLVLFLWLVSCFGFDVFQEISRRYNSTDFEGYNEENESKMIHALLGQPRNEKIVSKNNLFDYDANIYRHTQRISKKRDYLEWKYFQYLTLLFTEVYLDHYFRDPQLLLNELNSKVTAMNDGRGNNEKIKQYSFDDLHKLAFWNATGSGKTLLMHVHLLQYQYYQNKYKTKDKIDHILLITPNEGLSRQHLEELDLSSISAIIFDRSSTAYRGHLVEVIEITKLDETAGDKRVAVEALSGNNLVLVDEGHRGLGGDKWKKMRDKLVEIGFTFEYSATFGQAMGNKINEDLYQEYAKCILFDYSYRYFYNDGYGKDYRILNISEDIESHSKDEYLTGALLAYYQQKLLFADAKNDFILFNIEEPLMVFVGNSVLKGKTKSGFSKDDIAELSDVADVVHFIHRFSTNKEIFIKYIAKLVSDTGRFLTADGTNIFKGKFNYIKTRNMSISQIYGDILKKVFNTAMTGSLHLDNLKGIDGEIGLRIGDNNYFGSY